ncbi:MAG: MFS transporter [Ruminococcaceae bacterium]|nr:MFS transporter [Oscillospiraceae bacterium]
MKKAKLNQTSYFIAICTIVYFASYMTRKNYGAAMTEIIQALNVTKDEAGLVNTGLFLTYGAGQIFSGILGDHIAPRKLIFAGLVLSGVCNLLMPAMPNILMMTVLWAINGFMQSLFWPPLVRMMAENLDKENYNRACISVSMGSSGATIAIYLLSSLCVFLSGWELVFIVCGAFGLLVSGVWLFGTKDFDRKPAAKTAKEKKEAAPAEDNIRHISVGKLIAISGMTFILIAIVLQGMLRDGLDSWMPTLICETFDLSSSVSILTGVIMPIFAIISFRVAAFLFWKINNEMTCSVVLFAIGTICSTLLLPIYSRNVFISILLIAVTTACMHGINLILITWVPRYYARYGKVSTISGIMNAFTYIGSAISTYGFGALSERYGWYFTIGTWIAIAGVGTILLVFNIRRWRKFAEAD